MRYCLRAYLRLTAAAADTAVAAAAAAASASSANSASSPSGSGSGAGAGAGSDSSSSSSSNCVFSSAFDAATVAHLRRVDALPDWTRAPLVRSPHTFRENGDAGDSAAVERTAMVPDLDYEALVGAAHSTHASVCTKFL